jgi:hypothetical protein
LPAAAHGSKLGVVPDRKLRSDFTPGSTPWAMRRAQWSALGLTGLGLRGRRAALPPLAAPAGCGWLSVYARTVGPLGRGATLGALHPANR